MSEKYKGRERQATPREFTFDELVPYWQRIAEAIQAAPVQEEHDSLDQARDEGEAEYMKGAGRENLEKIKSTHDEPYVVKFPDFETLMAAFSANKILSRFLPEEQISAMIQHERAHLEEGKKHGYETQIGLTITKTAEGRLVFTPFVTVSVDLDEADETEIRKRLQDISRAPGGDMSDSDIRKL
jgi:hypothetical protein